MFTVLDDRERAHGFDFLIHMFIYIKEFSKPEILDEKNPENIIHIVLNFLLSTKKLLIYIDIIFSYIYIYISFSHNKFHGINYLEQFVSINRYV